MPPIRRGFSGSSNGKVQIFHKHLCVPAYADRRLFDSEDEKGNLLVIAAFRYDIPESAGYKLRRIAKGSAAEGPQHKNIDLMINRRFQNVSDPAAEDSFQIRQSGSREKTRIWSCAGDDINMKPIRGVHHLRQLLIVLEHKDGLGIDQAVRIGKASASAVVEVILLLHIFGSEAGIQCAAST